MSAESEQSICEMGSNGNRSKVTGATGAGDRRRRFWDYVLFTTVITAVIVFVRFQLCNITDDALITYRYAENLSRGDGLVYNPGERVYGTTTPLYAVVLAVATGLGIRPWYASLGLDVVFLAGLCWVFRGFSRRVGDRIWPWFFFPLFLVDPFKFMPTAGMESGFLVLLVYGAFLARVAGRRSLSVFLAAASGFVRPEGFLALGLLWSGAVMDVRRRRLLTGWLRVLVSGLVPLGVGFGLLYLFYGRIVPQSIAAKAVQGQAFATWEPWISWFARSLMMESGVVLSAIEWLGVGLMIFMYPSLRLVGLWYVAYVYFMLLGDAPYYHWYIMPLQPARMAALATGLIFLGRVGTRIVDGFLWPLRRVKASRARGIQPTSLPRLRGRIRVTLTACVAVAILVVGGWDHLVLMGKIYRFVCTTDQPILGWRSYEQAGRWIRENSRSGDEVALAEIGYVGYFSKRRVFDSMGLISKESLDRLVERSPRPDAHLDPWKWAVTRESKFVVFPFMNDSFASLPRDFCRQYAIGKVYPNRDGTTTLVFVRREIAIDSDEKAGWPPGKKIGVHPGRASGDYLAWPPE